MRNRVLVLIGGVLLASATHAGDNGQMIGQLLGGLMGGNRRQAPARNQSQPQQQPKGVAQALGILQALQGGGQAAPAPAQAAPFQALDPKDAAKMALLQGLLSGKKVDLEEVAGQALAAKLNKGNPNDPKSAMKAALIQKLLSGDRLDVGELAGTALASKLGGGGAVSAEGLSGKDRMKAMLLQQLLSGDDVDLKSIAVQILADKAEAKSSKLAAQNLRPGSKAALKNALLNEILGGGGLGGRSLQNELAATLQQKAGLQNLGPAQRQALLGMIAPQAAAPAVPSGYGSALAPPQAAPVPGYGTAATPGYGAAPTSGYGGALAPATSSGSDEAQIAALQAELDAYRQAPPPVDPYAGVPDAAPVAPQGNATSDQAQIDALLAEVNSYQQPAAPPPPSPTPAVVRSAGLAARIQALHAKQDTERIQIPLDSLPDAPADAVMPSPVRSPVAAPPAAAPRGVAGIDLTALEARDPEAAAALSKFSPEVLEAAAALLAAQQAVGAATPPKDPQPETVMASLSPVVPADPPPASRRAGPLARLRTGSSSQGSRSRVAALRARRAAEEAAAARPSEGWSAVDRGTLEKEIEEYWYDDMGITRFSRREQRLRADAQVRKTLEAVLAGEESWPPVPEAEGGSRVAPRRQARRAAAAREYTVREKMILHDKIRDEVFARERINRFSNRAAKVRAEAIVKTLVTKAMEDGSALDYLEE